MAISTQRLEQLRREFEPVKAKVDDVDRKYSLDYVEPTLDMPESLDLSPLEYVPKTEQQLQQLADEQTYASYLSNVNRLSSGNASANLKLDKQLLALEEKNRTKIANLLSKLNDEIENVNVKITNAGMLFSTVAERVKAKLRSEYEERVEQVNLSTDNEKIALEAEREQLQANFNQELSNLQAQRQAQILQAYNKLIDDERDEQTRVEKYNNALTEKEKKYRTSRSKAYEAVRQAEYNRSYAAKKLYQQMGATGYEESMLWEKYNIFVAHFANFTKREEAITLIQIDNYVRAHLKQYYTTLEEWINRNIPA